MTPLIFTLAFVLSSGLSLPQGFPATNDEDMDSNFVADIPDFVSTNNSMTVSEGGTVSLGCQVNKLSEYQLIWYKKPVGTERFSVLRIGNTPVSIKDDDTRFV